MKIAKIAFFIEHRNYSAVMIARLLFFVSDPDFEMDVTNTRKGERGTGNGEPETGVWEQVYSGNPLENSKWRSKQKKRLE